MEKLSKRYFSGPDDLADDEAWQGEIAFRVCYAAAAEEVLSWRAIDAAAINAAYEERMATRREFAVVRKGVCYYPPEHRKHAAAARGRHHAVAFVKQAWESYTGTWDAFMRDSIEPWVRLCREWSHEDYRCDQHMVPPRPKVLPTRG